MGLASPAPAIELVESALVIDARLWVLNADPVRQPAIPLLQPLEVEPAILTDVAIAIPTQNAATQVFLPADFGLGAGGRLTSTLRHTTRSEPIRLPNPAAPFEPFAAVFEASAALGPGVLSLEGGPAGGRGGSLLIAVRSRLVLESGDKGEPLRVEVDVPIVLGTAASGAFRVTAPSVGTLFAGTGFGGAWTTGRITVSRRVVTGRADGEPTRTREVTFTTEGSVQSRLTRLVAPVVVDAFHGSSSEDPAVSVLGFLRLSLLLPGVGFPEPNLPDRDNDQIPDRDDNCPDFPNTNQRDANRDGVGDACECGDFNADGTVNTVDARLIQQCAAGRIPCLLEDPSRGELCDASGDGLCNTTDARLVQRVAVGRLSKGDLRCARRPGRS